MIENSFMFSFRFKIIKLKLWELALHEIISTMKLIKEG